MHKFLFLGFDYVPKFLQISVTFSGHLHGEKKIAMAAA
jgi:hypothetical protein